MTQREAWRLATFIQRARSRRGSEVFTDESLVALAAFVQYSTPGYKAETWLKLALYQPESDQPPPDPDPEDPSAAPSEEWDKFIQGLLSK